MTSPLATRSVLTLMLVLAWHSLSAAQESSAEAFFESKIRPLLIEHCYECHSQEAAAKNQLKGGLSLDSAEGIRTGGDSGPAVDLSDIPASLILKAVRYEDYEMPPTGKLPASAIADIERWIASGAFHSQSTAPTSNHKQPGKVAIDIEKGKQTWPYTPITSSSIPDTGNHAWPRSPTDTFLLAAASAKSLQPAPEASREILVRRLYYDLTGLPPTPQEIDEFVHNSEPDAYERLVDKLLASPQFGTHWGRHWLDIVRYAESTTLRGLIYADAWRYRDYVIQSLQEDRPLKDFIREQIAGDLLPSQTLEDQSRGLIATTFLALGNHNLEEQDKAQLRMDVVDEQLDVIGQAFLGQTFGCARCHDHKFDPIPTKDYYALAGILRNAQTLQDANVSNWITRPLPLEPTVQATYDQLTVEQRQLQADIKKMKDALGKGSAKDIAKVVAINQLQGVVIDDAAAQKVGEWQKSQFTHPYVADGYITDMNRGKGEKTVTFQATNLTTGTYEVRLAYSHGANRASRVPVTVSSAEGEQVIYIDQRKKPDVSPNFVSLGSFRFEAGGQAYVLISTLDTDGFVIADAVQFLPMGVTSSLAETPAKVGSDKANSAEKTALQMKLSDLEKRLKEIDSQLKSRPSVMSVLEREKIEESYVHIRGLVDQKGAEVTRGFPQVTGGNLDLNLPPDQSGRLQLANWVVHPQNPLTSRVMVNRLWTWLFGEGLARDPDHIAPSSEKPENVLLIDYLASRWQQEGWSTKKMIRDLVLSSTYRQASRPGEAAMAADPDNRMWMRAEQKTLTAESIRDSILKISGDLDGRMFGNEIANLPASDFGYQHASHRQSVFMPMFRNSLPKMLVAFDLADSSRVTGRRNSSIVAPQALLMLNSEEVLEASRKAAQLLLRLPLDDNMDRLSFAFHQTLCRNPTSEETDLFTNHLGPPSPGADFEGLSNQQSVMDRWTEIYQTLFGCAEFRSLD